jgi:hypothetical protein
MDPDDEWPKPEHTPVWMKIEAMCLLVGSLLLIASVLFAGGQHD